MFVVTIDYHTYHHRGKEVYQPVIGIFETEEEAENVIQKLIKKNPYNDYLDRDNFHIEECKVGEITYNDCIIQFDE